MQRMPMTPGTAPDHDEQLLAGLRARKAEAFERLVEVYSDPLYRFFYFSHGDAELARDQSADTFAELVTALPKMRGEGGQLRAFIYGVARNVMRHGWRVRRLPLADDRELELVEDIRPGTFEIAWRNEAFRKAIDLIQEFDEPARQVMLLRFVEELKLDQIAQAMAMSLNTVKSHVRRGCLRLREMLETPAEAAGGQR